MIETEHPWRDWLVVVLIFLAGLAVVMVVVRVLINWAHRDDKPK
jgi:formate-dependent nitrite reductase membrane component NrfD